MAGLKRLAGALLAAAAVLACASSTARADVGTATVTPGSATAGAATTYDVAFAVGAAGALVSGSDTITIQLPAQTGVPSLVAADINVENTTTASAASLAGDPSIAGTTVTLTVPVAVNNGDSLIVHFLNNGAGHVLTNPTTAGSYTASVRTSVETNYVSSAAYTIDPGVAASFTVTTQNGQSETAGLLFAVTLTAKDSYGNTDTSYMGNHNITWTWTATSSPNSTAPSKPADGNRSFTGGIATVGGFTLTNAGQTPTITAGDGSISGTSAAITVGPGTAVSFALATQNGGSETAGTAFTVTLTAKDSSGNTDTNYTGTHAITWTYTATNSPNGTPPTKPANGNQAFTAGATTVAGFTLNNTGQTPTITADDSSINGTSAAITVSPGAQSGFGVTTQNGGTETAGTAFSVTATAVDAAGNTVTGYTGAHSLTWTWTATASPNSTAPTKPADGNQTFAAGAVTVGGFTLTNAGQAPTITVGDGSFNGTTAAVTVGPGTAASFVAVTQNNGTETAGTAFNVSLTAKDAYGNTATGYTGSHTINWTWTATSSPNSTAPTRPADAARTFFSGVATVSGFTLTNAGQTPTITGDDGSISGSTAPITVNPGAAAGFTVATQNGGTETAGTAFSVTVTAVDASGNTATGYTGNHSITWTWTATNSPNNTAPVRPGDGNQSFAAGTVTVDGFTLTNAGQTPTITGSDGSINGTTVAITVSAGVQTGFAVTTQNGGTETSGTAFSVTVTAIDAAGNSVSGYTGSHSITWSWTATNSPNNTAPVKPGDGNQTFAGGAATVAGFTLTNTTETPTITAGDGTYSGASAAITVVAGSASGFTVITQGGGTQTAGTGFSVTLTALDAGGNVATGYVGSHTVNWSWTATSSPNSTAPTRPANGNQTFTAGVATVGGFTLTNAGETPTITGSDGSINGTTAVITVNPGAAASFSAATENGGSETAGTAFSVTLTARDAQGNTATGYTGSHSITWTWTATASPNSTAPTRPADGNQTFVAGAVTVAGFTLTNAAETPTLTGSDGSVSGSTAAITVSPGAHSAFRLATQNGGSETAGTAFSITATAVDAQGNTVSAYTGSQSLTWTWTATSSPNNSAPSKPADGNQTFAAGAVTVAGFTLTNAGQTPTITVSDGSFSGSTAAITVGPGAAAAFGLATQNGGTETAGTAFSVTVTAVDGAGNVATGYTGSHTVNWTWTATDSPNSTAPVKPGDGSQSFTAGVATVGGFTLTNAAETPTVNATDTVISGSSAAVTVTPGAAAAFNLTTEHGGTETAGTAFSITVTALDAAGNVATGYTGSHSVTWTWTATNSPGGVAPAKPADGNQTFAAGAVTVIGFTLTNAGQTPTITAGDGGVSGTSPGVTVQAGAQSAFAVTTQNGGGETAGTPFSVTVAAVDAAGNPVTGYTGSHSITWSWTATASPNSTAPTKPANGNQTFAAGAVTVSGFTLTNAGQTPTITAGDGTYAGSSAAITVAPGAATGFGLATQNGGTETAGTAFSVTVTALDAAGNTATGYTGSHPVNWTWTAGNSPNSTAPTRPADGNQNFAAGVATVSGFTLTNAAETPTITAGDGGITGSSAAVTVAPGAAAAFSVATQNGGTETAGTAFSVTLTAHDALGNTATGYTGSHSITWTWAATSSPNNTAPARPADGNQNFTAGAATVAGFTLTNAAETPAITAGDGSISGSSAAVTVNPGTQSGFAVTTQNSGTETAGISFSVTVRAVDGSGNVVSGYAGSHSITWTWTAGNSPNNTAPTRPANGNQTFAAGAATVSGFTLTNAGQSPTITAGDGTLSGTSAPVTVAPGAAASFSVATQNGGTQTAGTDFSVTLTARDSKGNTATGYTGSHTITWTWTATAPQGGTAPVKPADGNQTFAAGVATVNGFTLTNAGQSPTITAGDGNLSGTSSGITVSSGTAQSLLVSTGTTTAFTGTLFLVTVTARDGAGNTLTTYSGTVHFTSTDSAASLPADYTFVPADAGQHSFAVALSRPGTYAVTATAVGSPGITGSTGSVSAVVAPPPPTAVLAGISVAGPTQVMAGQTVAFTATATSQAGTAMTVPFTWGASAGSISAGAWTAPSTPGVYSVSATAGGKTATVSVTVVHGLAASLSLSPPGPRTTPAGTPLVYTYKAMDSFGNAIADGQPVWGVTGVGSVADGRFIATAAGTATVTVTVDGKSSASGPITVTPGPVAAITLTPDSAGVEAGGSVTFAATVTDQYGNTIANAPITWSATGGTVTGAGVFTAGADAAGGSVTASSGGVTDSAAVTITVAPLGTGVAQFADTVDHWAAGHILKLQSLGLVSGLPDGGFHPDEAVNRYQIAKVLALAAGLDVAHADLQVLATLPDAAEIPEWARPYVASVVGADLMNGTGSGFNGSAAVTRAQMATLLGRLLPGSDTAPLDFTDAADIPLWAQAGAARAVAAGILGGFPDGSFRPGEPLTRAQMAKVVSLLLDTMSAGFTS